MRQLKFNFNSTKVISAIPAYKHCYQTVYYCLSEIKLTAFSVKPFQIFTPLGFPSGFYFCEAVKLSNTTLKYQYLVTSQMLFDRPYTQLLMTLVASTLLFITHQEESRIYHFKTNILDKYGVKITCYLVIIVFFHISLLASTQHFT